MQSKEAPDFKVLFESAPALYMVLSPQLELVALSDAYASATKITREKALGRNLFEVFPDNPDDPTASGVSNLRHSLMNVLANKVPDTMAVQKYDIRVPESEGGGFIAKYWSPINVPVLDENNQVKYIIHKVEDVTDYVRLKKSSSEQDRLAVDLKNKVEKIEVEVFERAQEIQVANKKLEHSNSEIVAREKELRVLYEQLALSDRQKTQFFANISHELRTPIALILSPVEKLLADNSASDESKNYLKIIKRNAQSLLKHVNDLLDLAKLDAGEATLHYEDVDVVQLFAQITESFFVLSEKKNIDFKVITPKTLRAQIDPVKLQRILMNLLSNAFKFTPENGTIICRLQEVSQKDVKCLQISVADSGPGIPEHLRKSVFERFFQVQDSMTRKTSGTGLGLAIVRDFVKLHKGTVSVETARAGGAQFIVEIPLLAPPGAEVAKQPGSFEKDAKASEAFLAETELLQDSATATPMAIAQRTGKPKVLVVEDNRDLRNFILDTLSTDFDCEQAANGKEGFEKALLFHPDVILTDLMMPEYSGEYLVENLRQHAELKSVPVIVLSAKTDDALRVQLLRTGVQDYLLKPFLNEELLARVQNQARTRRVQVLLETALQKKGSNLEHLAVEIAEKNNELRKLNRLKDEFLATVSHELRTPVSLISGYTDVLVEELQNPEGVIAEALGSLRRNATNQLRLVEDLLDLSKGISGKITIEPKQTDWQQVLNETLRSVKMAARGKDLHIEVEKPEHDVHLWTDPTRLTQILWNLLSNAVKFTPAGGAIKISSRVNGAFLEISVADNGEGISSDYLPYVFDRFSQQDGSITRRHGGLGLGLAVVKHLVDLHGGAVSAYSEGPGKGATFTVSLPIYQQSFFNSPEEPFSSKPDLDILKGRRILVVDDETDVLHLISHILTKYGVEVFEAQTVDEANALLKNKHLDAIISDIGMPGKNGFDFIRSVRDNENGSEHIPAMALTAFSSRQAKENALAAGFEMYVAKPVESRKLIRALQELIKN